MLLAASFPKFGHPAFAWIGLSPLIVAIVLERRRAARGGLRVAWLGFLGASLYFAGTLYWVVNVVATYGGIAFPVALIVGVLMVATQAIFPAAFAVLTGRATRVFGVSGVWLTPFLWVATEWLRATIFFAFPWVLLGTSQARVLPVVQAASVVGVYGLSWLVALVSAAAAVIALSRRPRHVIGAVAVFALIAGVAVVGAMRVNRSALLDGGRPLRVGLVQGNIAQDAKWNNSYRHTILDRHLVLTRQLLAERPEVIIWPESSTPFFFDSESSWAEPVRKLAAQTQTPLIIGTDEYQRTPEGDRYFNTAVLVGPEGKSQGAYRKMALVPFGEYVPLKRAFFFAGKLIEAVSDFSPGTDPTVFDLGGARRMSVAICYESVYPWLARAFVQRGSGLLGIITNDAWFGRSSAAYQHFEQGAVRAVEEGRFMVRAANTGISGAVDPYGRVLTSTSLFETTAFVVNVKLLDGQTFYSRFGDLIVWLSLLVTAGVLAGPVLYNPSK